MCLLGVSPCTDVSAPGAMPPCSSSMRLILSSRHPVILLSCYLVIPLSRYPASQRRTVRSRASFKVGRWKKCWMERRAPSCPFSAPTDGALQARPLARLAGRRNAGSLAASERPAAGALFARRCWSRCRGRGGIPLEDVRGPRVRARKKRDSRSARHPLLTPHASSG